MNILHLYRFFLLLASIASALTAGVICYQNTHSSITGYYGEAQVDLRLYQASGAAAGGFAVLSGLTLIALSITFLRKENGQSGY